MSGDEIMAIACNLSVGTKTARDGARAYLIGGINGMRERAVFLIKSRGGRWIEKWERIDRMDYFRIVHLPLVSREAKMVETKRHYEDSDAQETLQWILNSRMLLLQEKGEKAERKRLRGTVTA